MFPDSVRIGASTHYRHNWLYRY